MDVDDRLLDRYLEGDLSPDEHKRMVTWLERDPAHVNLLARRAELHADLRRSLKRRGIQLAALAAVRQTSESAAADIEPADRRESRWPARTKSSLITAALATAAALTFVLLRLGEPPNGPATPSLAQIVHQAGAQWVGERQEGTVIGAEFLQLRVGLAKLKFSNGVSVTLQGPADFEIISADQARLHSGILTAHVPESAIGFRIETPALQVVDLGTAFGVSVNEDGFTNVSVFEGEVEVHPRAEKNRRVTAQRIVGGQAIRAARASSKIEPVDFETGTFERAWPINSGVLQTTGVMKFVSPGPQFIPGRFEDSEHIVVFPERRGVLLESALGIDVAEPGEYRRLRDQPALSLTSDDRVRSYLLQLNPSGRDRTIVTGQITFDRPILGLIASSGRLAESDAVLGHPEGIYEQNRRGIEPPRKDPPGRTNRDSVILAADKRTLILQLGAGSALDQIRVIVDDPEPTWSKESK